MESTLSKIIPIRSDRNLLSSGVREKQPFPQNEEEKYEEVIELKHSKYTKNASSEITMKKDFFHNFQGQTNQNELLQQGSMEELGKIGKNEKKKKRKGKKKTVEQKQMKQIKSSSLIPIRRSFFQNHEESMEKQHNNEISYEEVHFPLDFIKMHIPEGKTLKASLKKGSGWNKFFPRSDLFFTQGLRSIMSRSSIFHLHLQKNENVAESELSFAGSVKSNFSGSLYSVYDENDHMVATIFYETQITLREKPRSLEIYFLSPFTEYHQLAGIDGEKNFKQLYEIPQNMNNNRIKKLVNKKPVWIEKRGAWALKFKGRKIMRSRKNMILIEEGKEEEIMVIGKVDEDTFQIQINYPLSPRIAMAIINSSFDFKWISQ